MAALEVYDEQTVSDATMQTRNLPQALSIDAASIEYNNNIE